MSMGDVIERTPQGHKGIIEGRMPEAHRLAVAVSVHPHRADRRAACWPSWDDSCWEFPVEPCPTSRDLANRNATRYWSTTAAAELPRTAAAAVAGRAAAAAVARIDNHRGNHHLSLADVRSVSAGVRFGPRTT